MNQRDLPVLGFEYETISQSVPESEEYEELARVTEEIFDQMYAEFFQPNPVVNYDTTLLTQYAPLAPLLVRFDLISTFEEGSVPSTAILKIAADRSFTAGQFFYSTYLARLRSMSSPVFSTTTSFRLITDPKALVDAQNRANGISEASFWEENMVKIVVPIAVATALCLLLCCIYYRRSRRELTMDELREMEEKVASNNQDNSDATTYVSDYRTAVFSDDGASRADTYHYEEPLIEEEEEEDDQEVMESLEEVPVEDEVPSAELAPQLSLETAENKPRIRFEEADVEEATHTKSEEPQENSSPQVLEKDVAEKKAEPIKKVEAQEVDSSDDDTTPEFLRKFKEMGLHKHDD